MRLEALDRLDFGLDMMGVVCVTAIFMKCMTLSVTVEIAENVNVKNHRL
jgi:hypothetical protein